MKRILIILMLVISTVSATPQDSLATKELVDSLFNDPQFNKELDAMGCLIKAGVAIAKSEYFEASKQIELAIAIDSTFGRSYLVRANLYIKLNRYKEALQSLNTAISYDSLLYAAFEKRGDVHVYFKENDKAIVEYSKAIELKPGHYKFYILRAKVYEKIGQLEKAIGDNKKAVELGTQRFHKGEAFYNLSSCYLTQTKYDKAITYGEKAVAHNFRKKFTHAYLLCGKAHEALGNKTSAIEAFNWYIFHEKRKSHIAMVKETIERVKSLGGIPKSSSLLR